MPRIQGGRAVNIGMTFDLKDAYLSRGFSPEDAAAFDSAIPIESIESVLKGLGHMVERIGSVDHLVVRLAGGDRWDMVFKIAEGVFGPGRVDVRMDAQGMPCFTEVNPLPGFNPHSSDLPILSRLTGGKFETLITSIMGYTENRAMQRTRFRPKRVA